jgi:hypothetical protein
MKRSRPIPWLTLFSTLLLALTVAAWIWTTTTRNSYENTCLIFPHSDSEDRIGIYWGRLGWCRFTYHPGQDSSWVPGFHKINLTFLGIGYFQTPAQVIGGGGAVKWNTDFRGLMIHCWLVTLLTAILPLRWLIHTLRHRNDPRDRLCQHCGYDLRAHPPGTKCPECGTPVLQ